MAFDIERFRSKINEFSGIAPSSRFTVSIFSSNPKLRSITNKEALEFLAFAVDIPGMKFSPDLVMLNGYGRINEVPLRVDTNNSAISFYVDNEALVYKFFYTWMNMVSNIDGKFYRNGGGNGFDEMAYAEDYYCDIVINYYGYNNTIMRVELYDAFPMELSGIGLDWNDQNTLTSCQATIGFRAIKNSREIKDYARDLMKITVDRLVLKEY
jgi:hypothetical protein